MAAATPSLEGVNKALFDLILTTLTRESESILGISNHKDLINLAKTKRGQLDSGKSSDQIEQEKNNFLTERFFDKKHRTWIEALYQLHTHVDLANPTPTDLTELTSAFFEYSKNYTHKIDLPPKPKPETKIYVSAEGKYGKTIRYEGFGQGTVRDALRPSQQPLFFLTYHALYNQAKKFSHTHSIPERDRSWLEPFAELLKQDLTNPTKKQKEKLWQILNEYHKIEEELVAPKGQQLSTFGIRMFRQAPRTERPSRKEGGSAPMPAAGTKRTADEAPPEGTPPAAKRPETTLGSI